MALTQVAHTPATAAAYNALIPKYLVQGSDQAITGTTLTDHNTFAAISIAADETWQLLFYFFADAAADVDDVKTQYALTGTLTFPSVRRFAVGPNLAVTVDPVNVTADFRARTPTTSVPFGVGTSTSNVTNWHEAFVVAGGASGGLLTLQWAQNTATSGATTMRAGSYMVGHRLL